MIFEIPKDTEVLQIDITEVKKQIRAEVIDEFKEKCKGKRYKPSKFTSINVVDYADIDEIAEQLKEQNK